MLFFTLKQRVYLVFNMQVVLMYLFSGNLGKITIVADIVIFISRSLTMMFIFGLENTLAKMSMEQQLTRQLNWTLT